ncbi:10359_t:CDS:2, partial [Cetraspora pellucida]
NNIDNEDLMSVNSKAELLITICLKQVKIEETKTKRVDAKDVREIKETNKAPIVNALSTKVLVLNPLLPLVQKQKTAAIRNCKYSFIKRDKETNNLSSSKATT